MEESKQAEATPKTFSEEYVHELREEAKSNRLKAKEYEDRLKAIEEEKAKATGEYKTLAEQLKSENEALKNKAELVEKYEKELSAIKQAQKDNLLNELDEEVRKDWVESDLDTLGKFVSTYKKLKADRVTTDSNKNSKVQVQTDGKTWSDFTMAEREELFKTNPVLYNKLKNDYFKLRR